MSKQGFTLIEFLLVIVLLSILAAITIPMNLRFFKLQAVSDTSTELVDVLRTAQLFALAQRHDSAYGVKLLDSNFILFEGASYDTRVTSEDVSIPFSGAATISGFDEVVFEQGTGMPDFVGAIMVVSGEQEDEVSINTVGTIE